MPHSVLGTEVTKLNKTKMFSALMSLQSNEKRKKKNHCSL